MTLFRDRPKPGFAFSAENETNAENGSLFLARNRNETAMLFLAEDENENETNIQDADEVYCIKPDTRWRQSRYYATTGQPPVI